MHGACQDVGELCIVYEYMPEGCLKDHLNRIPMPASFSQQELHVRTLRVSVICRDIAEGLVLGPSLAMLFGGDGCLLPGVTIAANAPGTSEMIRLFPPLLRAPGPPSSRDRPSRPQAAKYPNERWPRKDCRPWTGPIQGPSQHVHAGNSGRDHALHGKALHCTFELKPCIGRFCGGQKKPPIRLLSQPLLNQAPEAFQQGNVSEKSDIYSLGIIMNECLTLKGPWPLMTPYQVRHAASMSPCTQDTRSVAHRMICITPRCISCKP